MPTDILHGEQKDTNRKQIRRQRAKETRECGGVRVWNERTKVKRQGKRVIKSERASD